MCAPSAPAAPDYKGAAESTASSQRVNQYTPYGSLEYSMVPGTGTPAQTSTTGGSAGYYRPAQPGEGGEGGDVWVPGTAGTTTTTPGVDARWQSNMTLTPEAQKTLDSQMRVSSGLGAITENQLGAVEQQYSQPMNLQSVQDVADKSYSAQTARLDPAWAQREDMERTRLANQGLSSGGEAYGNAMRDFGQQRNDAYQQANLAAIQTMPQTYQLESAAYNQPLNALNALRTGAQVNNPQFGGAGQPTNYAGAAAQQGQHNQAVYGADVSSANSNNAAMAAIAAAMMSDRRLKRNIVRVGTHPLGIGIYEYDIFDRHEYGVMADEVLTVMPEAVVQHPSGYMMVNYGRL